MKKTFAAALATALMASTTLTTAQPVAARGFLQGFRDQQNERDRQAQADAKAQAQARSDAQARADAQSQSQAQTQSQPQGPSRGPGGQSSQPGRGGPPPQGAAPAQTQPQGRGSSPPQGRGPSQTQGRGDGGYQSQPPPQSQGRGASQPQGRGGSGYQPQQQPQTQGQQGRSGNGRDDRDYRDGRDGRDGRDNRDGRGDYGRGPDWRGNPPNRADRDRGRPRYDQRRYPREYRPQQRYQWRGSVYRTPPGFYIRYWSYGDILPWSWYEHSYYIDNWWYYSLQPPPVGFEWVRTGRDAFLVDVWTGRIYEVVYGLFW